MHFRQQATAGLGGSSVAGVERRSWLAQRPAASEMPRRDLPFPVPLPVPLWALVCAIGLWAGTAACSRSQAENRHAGPARPAATARPRAAQRAAAAPRAPNALPPRPARQAPRAAPGPPLTSYIQLTNNAPLAPQNITIHPYPGPVPRQHGEWPMPAQNWANWRYSALDQINTGNVGRLRLAWTFSTGVLKGEEAAPIVVGTTMYIVTPYPNIVYALNVGRHGALRWEFQPHPNPAAQGVACCDVVNRGAVYGYGNIYFNTLDDHTIALNAQTGKLVWKTRLDTIEDGSSMTMAPFLAHGHLIVGDSGGEFGVHGWVAGLDPRTGEIQWRGYSTGPDQEVLIGSSYHPYYRQFQGKNLGVKTWPAGAWKTGGGSVWGWISYDPKLNLIYQGVSNPAPWAASQRPGRNLFTSGIFARDPDNGQVHWYYQYSPHDMFDYDGVNENILLEEPIGGRRRTILLHPDRNGYVYEIDRASGQVLSAHAFVPITTSRGVNLSTGALEYVTAREPQLDRRDSHICPSAGAPAAKDWQPSAFSPKTNLVYIPHARACASKEDVPVNYIAGTPYVGSNVILAPGPGGFSGQFTAWDPITNEPVWNRDYRFPVYSGTLATAGNLVFFGTLTGWFQAVDARTGKLLWQFKCGSGIIGQPTSFRGPEGKQYIAILAGVGGAVGPIVAAHLNPADPTAGLGMVALTEQLPKYTTPGGMLYVFALP